MARSSVSIWLSGMAVFLFSSAAFAADWNKEVVFQGAAKPSLALGLDGQPRIAFLLEARPGFVSFAEKQGGPWVIQEVATGYFYGPIDIIVT